MIDVLNQLSRQWAEYFGLAVVQNTVILAIVLFMLHWLRNLPASLKYILATTGLVKLLLPPFLPAGQLIPLSGSLSTLPVMTTWIGSGGSAAIPEGLPAHSPATLSLLSLLFLLWIGAASFYIVVSSVSTLRLALILKRATPVASHTLRGIHLSPRVGVYKSRRIGSPLTLGLLGKRVFVPVAWDRWTPDCRSAVVRHEMAHIARHDSVFQFLQILAQALYLFHPLVWILNRRVKEHREMACDDASAGFPRDSRLRYSKCLVEVAESMMRTPAASGSASALLQRRNELLHRVHYQVEGNLMTTVSVKAKILAAVGMATLLLSLSWYAGEAATDAHDKNPAASKSAESGSMESVVLTIKSPADIQIDGIQTDLESLRSDLETAVQGTRDRVVVTIVSENDVTVSTLSEIEKHLRALDLMKVVYTTEEGEGLPLILPPLSYDEDTLKKVKGNVVTVLITSKERSSWRNRVSEWPRSAMRYESA